MQAFGGAVVSKARACLGKTIWRVSYQQNQGCRPTSKRLIFLMMYQVQPANDIAVRQLHVAVPVATTAAQWQQIQRAVQYGQSKNVQVIITPVR